MRRAVLIVTAAVAIAIASSAVAAAKTVHLSFKRDGSARGILTDGRYVLIGAPTGKASTLRDEQTGRRVRLPACATPRAWNGLFSVGFEGPYLEWVDCAATTPTIDLYQLATRTLRKLRVADTAGCGSDPYTYASCSEEPGPAGAYWYVVNVYSGDCQCTSTDIVNRQTGVAAAPMQGPVDLNSPTLARTPCAPLDSSPDAETLLFGGGYGFSGSGVAETWGEYSYRFQNSGASLGGFAIDPAGANNVHNVLLRCNSHLTRSLSGVEFTGNGNALIHYGWGDTQLHGLFLPSLRSFTIPLPSTLRAQLRNPRTVFVLTDRTLWAVAANHQVWTAPAPH